MDNNSQFFKEQSEQSYIKTEIVAKYFYAWAKVIIGQVKAKGDKMLILICLQDLAAIRIVLHLRHF